MQRRLKRKSTDYKVEYSNKLYNICKEGGYDLTKNFIIVVEDKPKVYPKPMSIVALTSEINYNDIINGGDDGGVIFYPSPDDTDGDFEEKRVFDRELATQKIGLEQPRYLAVVDHITKDGQIVVFDDYDEPHLFNDSEVMVVDLYYHMASSYDKTFVEKPNYKDSLLSIKMEDLYTKEQICDIISDNSLLMYERVMMLLPQNIKNEIKDIFASRGIILKGDKRQVIRVCLEYTLLHGEDSKKGITPYSIEALHSFREKGYHIDIISNKHPNGKESTNEIKNWLHDLGVVYETWNGNFYYDYIIDSRSAMNYNTIDWVTCYKKITGFDLIEDTDEDINLNNYLQMETENYLETGIAWVNSYDFFLTITKENYEELKNNGTLKSVYPLAPTNWEIIKTLQYLYNKETKLFDVPEKYKELIKILELTKYFK